MEEEAYLDASLDDWEFLPDHKSFVESFGQHNFGENEKISSEAEHAVIAPIVVPHLVPDAEEPNSYDELSEYLALSTKSDKEFMPMLIKPSYSEPEEPVSEGDQLCKAKEAEHKMVDGVVLDDPEVESGETEEEYMIKSDDAEGKQPCSECIGLTVWKWRVGGIGAVCSMGVAAASICILLFGGRQQQQQKTRFHFYDDDDKRISQAVQQASRLNQVMSAAVRGVPATITRASISFGGYYNGF